MSNLNDENFSSMIGRIFPQERKKTMQINGDHVYTITLQVTEDCNMACTYCYQHNKSPHSMSIDTGKKFIDMILAADERTNQYITSTNTSGCVLEFIGGEPFMQIELIDELTDYFIKECIRLHHPWATRYRIGISSNGLLYFDERVQNYIKKHHTHLSLGISIDGTKELHDMCRIDKAGNGTYDRAMTAAQAYMKTYGGQIGSKATLSPDNIHMCCESVISMINNGYTIIHINCVYEEGWTVEHARILYQQLKLLSDYILDNNLENDILVSILDNPNGYEWDKSDHTWCGGNGLMLCCDTYGDLYPCLRYTPSSMGNKQEPYIIGNVDEGIMTRPEWKQRVDCMSCVTRTAQCKNAKPECIDCPIATGCGDCAAYNYEVNGRVDSRATFICDMHKARVLASNYKHNKETIKHGENNFNKLNIPKDWAIPIIGEEEYNMLLKLSQQN